MPPVERVSRCTLRTADGVTLSLLEAAPARPASNLTIALIPGWCMPASIWRAQLDAFGARYHTIALDPRGQGESEVTASGYHFERRAADLSQFLHPYQHVLLIGWSLGALEALEYLHRYGDQKLAGLVLVDSSVGELPVPPPGDPFLQQLRANRDATLDDLVRAMFTAPQPESEIAALIRSAKRMTLDNSVALLSSGIPREHWKEIAHVFAKPLLYAVTPQFAEQARNLEKNRPGTQIEMFERAGHALFVDEPVRFNRLILNFADAIARRSI